MNMATKTEKRIERDFYEFVTRSELAKAVSGKVYRKGMRPPESDKEDIYVPDISVRSRGAKVENIKRIDELEELAVSFIEGNDSNEYDLEKDGTPKSLEAEGIEQHFISVRIKFKRITI